MRKKSKKREEPVTFQIEQVSQPAQSAQFIVEETQTTQSPKKTQPPPQQPVTKAQSSSHPQMVAVQTSLPSQIPMAQPVKKTKGPEFQCPDCGRIFILGVAKRPAHIKCPYCGLEGVVD